MAYGMNWRPELDRIADDRATAPSPAALGPVPGVLPPFRGAPLAQSAMSLPKPSTNSNSNGFTSYNMNWRPKYEDEEDDEPNSYANTEAPKQSAVPNSRVLPNTARSGEQQFRVSLAEDCPTVEYIGTSAFSATQDGLTCTLEKTEGVASIGVVGKWLLHLHPSNAPLTYRQTSQLSTLIYCCLYAALCKSKESSLTLKLTDPSASSTTARKALSNLGLPEDLSLPITPSFIMQLYQHVEPHLLTPPFPYFATQSFHGARQPVAHPARPPPSQGPAEVVYTRVNASDRSHSRILRQIVARGTEQLGIETASSSGGPSNAPSSLEIQLSWALEDASFSSIVEYVQDYDRAVHFDQSDDQTFANTVESLASICHYAFLTERRSINLWTLCRTDEDASLLSAKGWRVHEQPKDSTKAPFKAMKLSQKDYWQSIQQL